MEEHDYTENNEQVQERHQGTPPRNAAKERQQERERGGANAAETTVRKEAEEDQKS